MKKLLGLICVFALFTAFQCEDEPLEGEFVVDTPGGGSVTCEDAIAQTAQAAAAFVSVTSDGYTATCNAYRTAIQSQIQACGDADGVLQTALTALGDCSSPNQDECQVATTALTAAKQAYDAANPSDDDFEDICEAYEDALEDVIDECGDADGSLQQQLDALDCDDDAVNNADLEGTWLLTAWIGTEPIDLNNDGTESTNFLEEMECYTNETLVFNNDNTGQSISTSFADIDIFLETGSDSEVDFSVDCIEENETDNFTWSQADNTVSITNDFGTNDWTLDGNTLSIVIPEGFSVENDQDADVSITQDLTFVYTKQ